jgi:hypothetical protein
VPDQALFSLSYSPNTVEKLSGRGTSNAPSVKLGWLTEGEMDRKPVGRKPAIP